MGGVPSNLTSEGFHELEGELFVADLWTSLGAGGRTGLQGLYCIPAPASLASDLAFSFAADEGKGYVSGKQLSMAENQAAGSRVGAQLRIFPWNSPSRECKISLN